jgi:2-oxoglutarate ferredoxin oxidoreductase subunit beta
MAELKLDRQQTVLVSGIGQAAKIPQYLEVDFFNGLHGRALPTATAIMAGNPELTVIAESGDGDMYGEGGNHFLHCIRRNPDLTNWISPGIVDSPKSCYNAAGGCHDTEEEKVVYARVQD